MVDTRLVAYTDLVCADPPVYQSAYRRNHSTKTALVRLYNDIEFWSIDWLIDQCYWLRRDWCARLFSVLLRSYKHSLNLRYFRPRSPLSMNVNYVINLSIVPWALEGLEPRCLASHAWMIVSTLATQLFLKYGIFNPTLIEHQLFCYLTTTPQFMYVVYFIPGR